MSYKGELWPVYISSGKGISAVYDSENAIRIEEENKAKREQVANNTDPAASDEQSDGDTAVASASQAGDHHHGES